MAYHQLLRTTNRVPTRRKGDILGTHGQRDANCNKKREGGRCRRLNGHVGIDRAGHSNVHGGHGLDVVNEDGIHVLDFATAYGMRIMNTFYHKGRDHLVTYNSEGRESQIDYIILRKEYAKECTNCKLLPKGSHHPAPSTGGRIGGKGNKTGESRR